MTNVAKDRLLFVDTSRAVGTSLAHMLCQLAMPKRVELRQVQQEENLQFVLKEGSDQRR